VVRDKGPWVDKDVNRLFRLPYDQSKQIQYAWLKAEFRVEHPENMAGLSLGRIYDTDRVFVNGILCGERKLEDIQEFHLPRNYALPPGVLKKGPNEIMIHLGVYGKEFGGIKGEVRLLTAKSFKRDKVMDSILFQHIPMGIMAMLLGLFAIILISHVFGAIGYPVFVVLGVITTWLIHLAVLFFPIQPLSMETRINILWLCLFANSVFFVLFVQVNFRVFFKHLTFTFIAMEVVSALWVFLGNSPISPDSPGKILGTLSVFATNVIVIYLFFRLRNLVDQRTKIVFFALAFIPGEVIGLDILNYLYGTHSAPYFHIYGIPFLMLLVMILHRKSLVADRRRVKDLTMKLKELSSARYGEETRAVVTAQVRHKLNTLMEYIHSSFNRPLTREELAEKIDLSPDYLSRMFKAHTGKKINDYINDVRIREACRLLLENRDDKIIDIAFVVGFESLATFNRAFMKTMNLSPTEYRQNAGTGSPGSEPLL
jgi:AraC-like DNA-binding protein